MAVSRNTMDSFADTAPSGSTATASVQPFDNTHTVLVRNNGAVPVYVALTGIATGLSSQYPTLGAGEAVTWRIGTITERPGGSCYTNPVQVLRIYGVGGTALVQITYLNSTRSAPA